MNLVKDYKQYFTPDKLAEYMVNMIPDDSIKTVIDLSMGECGLLEKAKDRWPDARLYGADIDEELILKINKDSPYIKTFHGDSLSSDLENWKSYNKIVKKRGFDLAIANPPFDFYKQSEVDINQNEKKIMPIEIRFLYQYIDIVKENGYICIILPYGFLSLDLYKEIRRQLPEKVTIIKIMKIFNTCFKKIDADTCLMLMKKKKKQKISQSYINVQYLDSDYELSVCQNVQISETDRWDLEYQSLLKNSDIFTQNVKMKKDILGNYIQECRRGKSITNNKELLADKGIRYIHTTDLQKLYITNKNKRYVSNDKEFFEKAVLSENMVLIGRVGKGCLGKTGIVLKSYSGMFFSDCIYAVRLQNINPYYVTLFLASEFGQMQLKGIAKGSCSKYITQEGLFNICILIPDRELQDYYGNEYKKLISRPGPKNEIIFADLVEKLNQTIRKER